MRLSRALSFFTSLTAAPPYMELESEGRPVAKKADSLPTGTDEKRPSSFHRRSQLSAMERAYPIIRSSELPRFGLRVTVRSWVHTIINRCQEASHYGTEVRARVKDMRVVSFTHYKERCGSGNEYTVARLQWVEGHESQEVHKKAEVHKGEKRCKRGEDGRGGEGARGGRLDGQYGKVKQEKPDIFLRFERGGPRAVPISSEPPQRSMTMASVSRFEPDDFVTRIDQPPAADSASVIADAIWLGHAETDRPNFLSLTIACLTVHKHDTGCYFKNKNSQRYAFANILVALLSKKFGCGNLVISPEGGKWWYFPIYIPKADVGQSLLATYEGNMNMIQEMIKEGIVNHKKYNVNPFQELQQSINEGHKKFREQMQQLEQMINEGRKEFREQTQDLTQTIDEGRKERREQMQQLEQTINERRKGSKSRCNGCSNNSKSSKDDLKKIEEQVR